MIELSLSPVTTQHLSDDGDTFKQLKYNVTPPPLPLSPGTEYFITFCCLRFHFELEFLYQEDKL